jgi:hypothetical protein
MSASTHTLGRSPAWVVQPGALRRFAAVFVAGGFAGMIAGGLGSRVAMRIAALAAPERVQGFPTEAGARIGEVTLEGTLFLILLAGIGSAVIGSAFYLLVRSWLPRRRWLRAIAFGGLELVVFGTQVLDAGNADFTIVGNPVLNVALFGGLFILHGALLVLFVEPGGRLLRRFAGQARWRDVTIDAASGLAAVLTVGLTAVVVPAFGLRFGPLGPAIGALVVAGIGLAVVDPRRARPLTRPLLTIVGGFALTLLAVGGTVQLLDELTTILG